MNGKLGDNNHFCIYNSSLCVDMVNEKNWILFFKVYLPIFFVFDIVVRFLALVTTMVTKVDHGNHRSNNRGNDRSNHRGYYDHYYNVNA